MIWSKRNLKFRLEQVRAGLQIHRPAALLGFNEPDNSTQANMTINEAVAAWPALEGLGVRLGSPAVASSAGPWLSEFMAKATVENLRVDFMTFHSYQNPDAKSFLRKVTSLYETYGKPIWVTEFAVADWAATSKRPISYTTGQVREYMTDAALGLRELKYVERFAWHSNSPKDPMRGPSALFTDGGALTEAGRAYSSL